MTDSLNGVHRTGDRESLSADIVGLCRDGRITPSRFSECRGPGYHEVG
jgi:hypothetical protein